MSVLPVPAKQFFSDFSFDILVYSLLRNGSQISTLHGLINSDENGNYIGFLVSDEPDIQVGDILIAENKQFQVLSIDYDCYQKNPEILKAYY